MPTPTSPSRWLVKLAGAAALGTLAALTSGCAQGLETNVTRFQSALPAPQGQSFAIVADDPALKGGIEFGQYARLVAGEMAKRGYVEAANPEAATLLLHFGYSVDKGKVHVRSAGFADPYWGPWYGGRHGWGGYGRGYYGRGFSRWGYGWYDPWFDRDLESYSVYSSDITLKIDSTTDHKRVFEGKAVAASSSNRLSYLVPNLVEAMFTGFPGNSGETLHITVAPEKASVTPKK
jgi:hypothetical protein